MERRYSNLEYVNKNDVSIEALPGRGLLRIIGKNSCFDSNSMSVGYALYSEEYGIMEPHRHAEETVIITAAKDGYVSWGDQANNLRHSLKLESGMVLHIPENEWHVFTYDQGGYVEIIFIYGNSENLRPEDK